MLGGRLSVETCVVGRAVVHGNLCGWEGGCPTLSIEGCTVLCYNNQHNSPQHQPGAKYHLDFHSHFVDCSKQDTATTFEHMWVVMDKHIAAYGLTP